MSGNVAPENRALSGRSGHEIQKVPQGRWMQQFARSRLPDSGMANLTPRSRALLRAAELAEETDALQLGLEPEVAVASEVRQRSDTRSIASSVLSIQPDPISSPIRTLPELLAQAPARCSLVPACTKHETICGGCHDARTLRCQHAVDLLLRFGHSRFLPWCQSPQCRSCDER
jgi:hypothetical protein